MKKTILILDDEQIRHQRFAKNYKDFKLVHTYDVRACLNALMHPPTSFDYICLDHDLGGKQMVPSGPGIGYEIAEWIADHPECVRDTVFVHSLNTPGRKNIVNVLEKAGIKAIEFPFMWDRKQ